MPRPISWGDNDPLLSHGRDHKTRLITLWLHGHNASTRHGFLSLEESRIQRYEPIEQILFKSMLANIAIYGPCIVGGIGAGMLTEIWINKKVQKGQFYECFCHERRCGCSRNNCLHKLIDNHVAMPRPIRWAGNDPLLSHGRDHKDMVMMHQPDMGFCLLRNQEYRADVG
ncbi:hypothetical protein CTI12_AA451530 [Artemisia annua]|uniref:Uncharacterized protein n=1 Tax=Artemisia annua TaxID=35608 RepID=A0A2U1LEL2_ARTAN|nr:hypothetical protein CTI12_AA451530 [Artemisia annua]